MSFAVRSISILLLAAGCSAPASPPPARSARAAPEPAEASAELERSEATITPGEQLRRADRLYTEQLGAAGRDDRYVERQVAALREAILLYEQFIERAGDAAQYRDAVRRSHERIEDARATIDFLLAKSVPEP